MSTLARSFKEAQSYLSFLMMAQMVPGMMATMNTMASKAWMYYVPWIGQQTLLIDVLGNKPISPLVFVIVGVVNMTLAVVILTPIRGWTALREVQLEHFGVGVPPPRAVARSYAPLRGRRKSRGRRHV